MKTNGNGNGHLQKLYGALTPRERTAALMEAFARKDETEVKALTDSAPRKGYSVVHHNNEMHAMLMIAEAYALNQLCTGLRMTMLFLMTDRDELDTNTESSRSINAARMNAYSITERLAAWERICRELGVSPKSALVATSSWGELSTLTEMAKALAPDPTTAQALWNKLGWEPPLPTSDDIYRDLHDAYNLIANLWNKRIDLLAP